MPDRALLAGLLAGHGVRVTEPGGLAAALRTALGTPGPALLDVVTEPRQTPITAHRDALWHSAAAAPRHRLWRLTRCPATPAG